MVTLIVNGEVYGPEPRGAAGVLILGGRIAKVGQVERAAVEGLGVQLRGCILEHGFSAEQVLPLVTTNTTRALKLGAKGKLDAGKDADIVVLRKDSLEIVEVIANGKRLVANGCMNVEEPFRKNSKRRFTF